jgi:anthranilate 1,2-dioxygenase small subunit
VLQLDSKVYGLILRAQSEYARCIDDDQLEAWLDLFTEDARYTITTADNYRQGLPAGMVYADSRAMLEDRVTALRKANIYERQTYRHLLGQPAIVGEDESGTHVETSFMVARIMRTGETTLFATGKYVDVYRIAGDMAKLVVRTVVCDSSRIDTLLAIPL